MTTRATHYKRAALKVFNGRFNYSCSAIVERSATFIGDPRLDAREAYSARFSVLEGDFWGELWHMPLEERRKWRETALCFAATMARRGDL